MQLCSSLNILWHCLSLGLERKLTFFSPVATAEFTKFAGILSVALSQRPLLGLEIAHKPRAYTNQEACNYMKRCETRLKLFLSYYTGRNVKVFNTWFWRGFRRRSRPEATVRCWAVFLLAGHSAPPNPQSKCTFGCLSAGNSTARIHLLLRKEAKIHTGECSRPHCL